MKQLPNLLSAARLALAPYIFHLLWTTQFQAALWWFAFAGISDGLDGLLARRLKAQSKFGAYMDPVADKALLSGSFLVLGLSSRIPLWLTAVVIGRDLIILAFAIAILLRGGYSSLAPSTWGKWSTVVQIVYVLLVVLFEAGFIGPVLAATFVWIVLGLTAWSGIDYARRLRLS